MPGASMRNQGVKLDLTMVLMLLMTQPSAFQLLLCWKVLRLPQLELELMALVSKDWLYRLVLDTITDSDHNLYLQWAYLYMTHHRSVKDW